MMNLDLAQLRAFKAVIDEGTFDAAATVLDVTPSAVSQRIKALEGAVGRVLLQRTNPVTLTESGTPILLLARQIATLTDEAAAQLDAGHEHKPNIPLAINADCLATWALPALAQISQMATFEVFREDQEQTAELLHEGRVMAAVTSQSQPVQGCVSIRLGKMRYQPLATAKFIKQWFPNGITADALADAPVIDFDRNDTLQSTYLRRHLRRSIGPPRTYIPTATDYLAAVRHGMGWGLIPHLQNDSHLVSIEPGAFIDVPLYWQHWKLSSQALATVTESVVSHAKQHLL